MGRRKIQIQPITNERNRSVTFLKRKNGLFKKAYELGVLCSVEIAVIIFDERNGHEPKLHQYSSCDVHDIIQRHLRHDGEKDIRGPSDFSDNAGRNRRDNAGEADDDDDVDDDVDDGPVSSSKRGDVGYKRGGAESPGVTDMNTDLDYIPRVYRSHSQNQSYSTPNLRPPPSTLQHEPHLHPISSDRFQQPNQQRPSPADYQNKRPRLDIPSAQSLSHPAHRTQLHQPHSSSSSDDPSHFYSAGPPAGGGSGYSYHPARPIWPPQPLPLSSAPHRASPSHSRSNPNSNHQQPDGYPQDNFMFPHFSHGDAHDASSRPHSFNSPQSGFALQPLQTPSSHPSHRPHSASTSSTSGDPAFFQSRTHRPVQFDGIFETGRGPPGSGEGARGNSLATLLDTPNQSQAGLPLKGGSPVPRVTTSAASFGIDWPMHASLPSSNHASSPPPASTVSPDRNKSADIKSESDQAHAVQDGGDVGWLDLLSGAGGGATLEIATPFVSSMLPASGSTPKESLGTSSAQRVSWERGGGGTGGGESGEHVSHPAGGNSAFPSTS